MILSQYHIFKLDTINIYSAVVPIPSYWKLSEFGLFLSFCSLLLCADAKIIFWEPDLVKGHNVQPGLKLCSMAQKDASIEGSGGMTAKKTYLLKFFQRSKCQQNNIVLSFLYCTLPGTFWMLVQRYCAFCLIYIFVHIWLYS